MIQHSRRLFPAPFRTYCTFFVGSNSMLNIIWQHVAFACPNGGFGSLLSSNPFITSFIPSSVQQSIANAYYDTVFGSLNAYYYQWDLIQYLVDFTFLLCSPNGVANPAPTKQMQVHSQSSWRLHTPPPQGICFLQVLQRNPIRGAILPRDREFPTPIIKLVGMTLSMTVLGVSVVLCQCRSIFSYGQWSPACSKMAKFRSSLSTCLRRQSLCNHIWGICWSRPVWNSTCDFWVSKIVSCQ